MVVHDNFSMANMSLVYKGNLLVHQSLAVRRKSLQAVTDGQNPDMSASPQLKTRKKAQNDRKGMKGGGGICGDDGQEL